MFVQEALKIEHNSKNRQNYDLQKLKWTGIELLILTDLQQRSKLLDGYEGFVVTQLKAHPETTAAQMHDWLKEHYPGLPAVSAKTVYNFVMDVRRRHNIPVNQENAGRPFGAVQELPYGQQAQVDFGQYHLRAGASGMQKVWFFAMVLAASRMKYCCFQCQPFTTQTVCTAHEKAFAFFNGIPQTIVYDQDSTLLSDENAGELMLTNTFSRYTQSRSFRPHFCRKSDPQSKGKIESVIKYIKQNFLYNRCFSDIDNLNQQGLDWLARTANALPHHVTKQPPCDAFEQEKSFLQPFVPLALQQAPALKSYTVRKTNEINYHSNFYSLPQGTYKNAQSKVWVKQQEQQLHIYDAQSSLLCTHELCGGKGKKIIKTQHLRDTSASIKELMQQLSARFSQPDTAFKYFETIRKTMPRHIRDQLQRIKKAIGQARPIQDTADKALHCCIKNQCYSASDFESVLWVYLKQIYLQQTS